MSEFEKERAELLKAIESQAQQISSSRSEEEADSGHTLKDWLNAAEEVMPDKSPSQPASNQSASEPANPKPKPGSSRTSFFGVIILLSLLLTILGVLYIAYTTISKELQEVMAVKQETRQQTEKLQASVDALQKSVASGGQPAVFSQLEVRVSDLEAQLAAIQEQQQLILDRVESRATAEMASKQPETTAKPAVSAGRDQVVTESILDEKLQTYTSQLESKIDQKLEKILQYLTNQPGGQALKQEVMQQLQPEDKSGAVTEAQEPVEPKVETPRVKQPIVKLVEPVATPKVEAVSEPIKEYTGDAKWLMDQPAQHYVLQLASMAEKAALQKMVRRKGLADTRIVLQKRPSGERYVLITGSYRSRDEANQRASEIKSQYGISPWVRKMQDLTSKLP